MSRLSLALALCAILVAWTPGPLPAEETEPSAEVLDAFARSRGAEESPWETGRPSYIGTEGRELARRDIARERVLAERARERGLHEDPAIAEELARQPLLVSRELADNHVQEQVTVTNEDIEAWYEANPDRYTRPARAEFQFLFERVESADDEEAARERLAQRRSRVVEDGESFVALVAEQEGLDPEEVTESEVSLTGRAGQYSEEIDNLLFSLEPGEISEPTRTQHGWHVVRLLDRTEEQRIPLEARRVQIESQVRRAKLADFRRQAEEQLAEAFPLEWNGLPGDGGAPEGGYVLAALEDAEFTAGEVREHLAVPPAQATEEQWRQAAESAAVPMRLHLWAREEGWQEGEYYRQRLAQRENGILARAYFDHLVEEEIDVTGEQEREYFEENQSRFMHRKEYEVKELFLSAPTAAEITNRGELHLARERVREAMERIREALAGGMALDDLPEELPEESSGLVVTDRGWAPQGPRGRLLDVSVQDLEPGEFSGVEESRRGFHVFILEDTRSPRPMEFEEARERIRAILRGNEREELRTRLVAEIDEELGLGERP